MTNDNTYSAKNNEAATNDASSNDDLADDLIKDTLTNSRSAGNAEKTTAELGQKRFLVRLFGNNVNQGSLEQSLQSLASAQQIEQLFTILNVQITHQSTDLNPFSLGLSLKQCLDNAESNLSSEISKPLDDCLTIINQIFNYYTQNKYLAVECSTLISHLRFCFIKLALTDKTLFLDAEHPARNFLNLLLKISLLWDEKDPKTKQIFSQIEIAVKKVISLADQKDIAKAFSLAHEQLDNFATTLYKRIEIFEKRILEAEQGKAKAEQAKLQAREQLIELTHGLDLPAFVMQFFQTAWEHILFLEQLKSNAETESQALSTAKQLLISLYPKNDEDSLKKLNELLPILKQNLDLKLEHTCYNQAQSTNFLHLLNQHQQKAIVQSKKNIEESNKETIIRLKPSQPLDFDLAQEKQETTEKDIASMSLLEWIEYDFSCLGGKQSIENKKQVHEANKVESTNLQKHFQINHFYQLEKDKRWHLAKLIGFIEQTDEFIWVSLSGNKLAQLTSAQLKNAANQKQIKPIDQQAGFDKALNRMQIETYEMDLRLKQKQQTEANIEAELKRIEELKKAKQAQIEAQQQKLKAEQEARLAQKKTQSQIQDITQLAVGSRVDIVIDDKTHVCRLAAKIASSGNYIFVDRSGIKIKQCLSDELKQLFEQGKIKLKQKNEASDHALASVISRTRQGKI